jgi:hypothetical protein
VNELEKMLSGKQARIWRRYSGGRVSLCQKWGTLQKKRTLHNQFAERGTEEVSIHTPWIENDQIELNALRHAPIKMDNTSLDASLRNIRGMWSRHTRKCLPKRKWTSSGRRRRCMSRVQTTGNTCHLSSLPFR